MNRKLIAIFTIVVVAGAGAGGAYGIFALQSTGSPPPASLSPTDAESDPTIEGSMTVTGTAVEGGTLEFRVPFIPA